MNDIIFNAIEDIKLFHFDYDKEIADGVYSIPIYEEDKITLKIKFDSENNKWYAVVHEQSYEIDISEGYTKIYVNENSFKDISESLELISYSYLAGAKLVVIENQKSPEQKEVENKSKSKNKSKKVEVKRTTKAECTDDYDCCSIFDDIERIKDVLRKNPKFWM